MFLNKIVSPCVSMHVFNPLGRPCFTRSIKGGGQDCGQYPFMNKVGHGALITQYYDLSVPSAKNNQDLSTGELSGSQRKQTESPAR